MIEQKRMFKRLAKRGGQTVARALALFVVSNSIPTFVSAEDALSRLSPSQRERVIRESLFAPGNPERDVGKPIFVPPAESELLPGTNNSSVPQTEVSNPPQGSSLPQQYFQPSGKASNNRARFNPPPPNQTARPAEADKQHVGVNTDGSVRVRTGVESVDRTAEQVVNQKVRSVIRKIWH